MPALRRRGKRRTSRRDVALLNWLSIERGSEVPLYKQISGQIRDAILSGRLTPSDYLPASRALAKDLGVSRITTLQAYEQLTAEGFLESLTGSGTRIASALAGNPLDRVVEARTRLGEDVPHTEPHLQELYEGEPPGVAFQPGIPAFDAFPRLLWSRLLQRHALRSDQFILDYAHIGGYAPLRQELAKYLGASRGVICTAEQVIVTTSVRASIAAICAVLLPPGSDAIVEDPGYLVARRSFRAAGLRILHVPVDKNGIRVEHPAFRGNGLAAYVTPAHQWPTETTLSAGRRLSLLDWAARRGGWILEDDYDSEFRFDTPPVATLHALAGGQHVIYIGTFSKTLVPSIRCAYLVVPARLGADFEQAVYQRGCEPALHVQAALSDLLSEGHFVRHITRMRKLYRHRRDLLVAALTDAFGGRMRIIVPHGGLQIIAELPEEVPAARFSRSAAGAELVARDMAAYHADQPVPNAVHLGFAAVPDTEIEPAVGRLRKAVAQLF